MIKVNGRADRVGGLCVCLDGKASSVKVAAGIRWLGSRSTATINSAWISTHGIGSQRSLPNSPAPSDRGSTAGNFVCVPPTQQSRIGSYAAVRRDLRTRLLAVDDEAMHERVPVVDQSEARDRAVGRQFGRSGMVPPARFSLR